MIFRKINSHLPKSTLLIVAGALFIVSLFSAYYFSVKPSVKQEERKIEHYIHKQQKEYQKFIADTNLMRKLVQRRESLEEFKAIADKDYGIFLFAESLSADEGTRSRYGADRFRKVDDAGGAGRSRQPVEG